MVPFLSSYGNHMEFCNKGTLSCHFQLVRHNLHNLKPYLYLNQSINQLGTIVEQGLEPCTWNLSTISFTKRLTPANTFLAIHENRHTTVSNNVFVPCVALGIQNADYSQTIERLQANSIIWPLRQARIRTLHYWFQKRCGCWLRMIARLPLGNTLTDRFLYLQYPFCHCLTIWGNYIFDSSGTVG